MRHVGLIAVLLAVWVAAGASTQESPDVQAPMPAQTELHREAHGHAHPAPGQSGDALQVVLVASELTLGPNRFAVGLFGADGSVVREAEVHVHYFDLSEPQAPRLESEADAVPLQTPDGATTIFAHERRFARAGNWGAEVQARFPDGTVAVKRIAFVVEAKTPSLKVGDKVPALNTPTLGEVSGDLGRLTSASRPNPAFYRSGLAESVASGKPTALLFATPAYCRTRFCGPAYDTVSELQAAYGDEVNFLHLEVYTGLPNPAAEDWQLAPAMTAFGLHTEPWLYLIGADGRVAHRVEGLFTYAEIERHLLALLGR